MVQKFTFMVILLASLNVYGNEENVHVPRVSRRSFLLGVSGVTAKVILPELPFAPAPILPKAAVPAGIGRYDLILFNEGYASIVLGLVTKANSGNWDFFVPDWKGAVGIGPWLTLYEQFQTRLGPTMRSSLTGDRAFIKFAQEEILPHGSLQHLLELAQGRPAPPLNLPDLARVSIDMLIQFQNRNGFETADAGAALKVYRDNLIEHLKGIDPFAPSTPETVKPNPASTVFASPTQNSILEHALGLADFEHVSRESLQNPAEHHSEIGERFQDIQIGIEKSLTPGKLNNSLLDPSDVISDMTKRSCSGFLENKENLPFAIENKEELPALPEPPCEPANATRTACGEEPEQANTTTEPEWEGNKPTRVGGLVKW